MNFNTLGRVFAISCGIASAAPADVAPAVVPKPSADHGPVLAEKEGLRIHVHFVLPLDRQNPKILCEMENTTGLLVPYHHVGSMMMPPLDVVLVDEAGKTLEKEARWEALHVTGESLKSGPLFIPDGGIIPMLEIDLNEAYGDRWRRAVRLDAVWNARDALRGPSKGWADWGTGSGLTASFDVTPLTGGKFVARPAGPFVKPVTVLSPEYVVIASRADGAAGREVGKRAWTLLGEKGIASMACVGSRADTVDLFVQNSEQAEARRVLAAAVVAEGLRLDLLEMNATGDGQVVVKPETVLSREKR